MRAVLLLAALVALGASAVPSAENLAGRFTRRVANGDISGARFTTTDTILIVPVDRANAYLEMQLSFFNGHQCSIAGMATMEGSRLVLRDADAQGFDGAPCQLSVWREGSRLRWSDGGGSCRSNCGARGRFDDTMRWSARRILSRAERARILADFRNSPRLP